MSKEELEMFFDYTDELETTMHQVEDTSPTYFYNKLHEESGEVAEVVSALLGSESKQRKITKKCGSVELALLEELADTINVAMIIGLKHGFTPGEILSEGRRKMAAKNKKRRNRNV